MQSGDRQQDRAASAGWPSADADPMRNDLMQSGNARRAMRPLSPHAPLPQTRANKRRRIPVQESGPAPPPQPRKHPLTTPAIYVLVVFMADASTAAVPPNRPDPPQDLAAIAGSTPTRSGRLIGLVRRLIDYGKELVATLRQPCSATQHFHITRNFGTLDIALIIARITRGLRIAAALESRLVRTASRLDGPPPRAVPDASPRPASPRPLHGPVHATPPAEDDAALLARLPTPEEIAARVRRRPIGVVITDICNDLGIVTSHKLWRELHEAVLLNGGSLLRLVRDLCKRTRLTNFIPPDTLLVPPMPHRQSAAAPWPSFEAGTGPP